MHSLSTVTHSSSHSFGRRCAQDCPQGLWKTMVGDCGRTAMRYVLLKMTALTAAAHLIVDGPPVIFADTLASALLGDAAEELIGYHRLRRKRPSPPWSARRSCRGPRCADRSAGQSGQPRSVSPLPKDEHEGDKARACQQPERGGRRVNGLAVRGDGHREPGSEHERTSLLAACGRYLLQSCRIIVHAVRAANRTLTQRGRKVTSRLGAGVWSRSDNSKMREADGCSHARSPGGACWAAAIGS